jgi:hypothetical protein
MAILGLLALTSGAAPYIVKYTNTPPSGPSDAAWNKAYAMTGFSVIAGTPTATDCSFDVRYLWDGTNLYGRIMVTDNIHNYAFTDDKQNHYYADIVEFYINAANSASTTFVPGATQDAWAINGAGSLQHSNGQATVVSTSAQMTMWTDPNFDPMGTSTTTATKNGNYGIQGAWPWTVAGAGGGLSLAATPTPGQFVRLGGGVDDADTLNNADGGTAAKKNYILSTGITWTNPSTYVAAQLAGQNPLVMGATTASPTTLNVVYLVNSTATTLDAASASNAANYVLSSGITVSSAALQPDGVTVRLTTSPMVLGTSYNLTVTGVQDAAGYPITPNPAMISFVTPLTRLTTQHIAPGGGTLFTVIPNPSAVDLAQSATFSSPAGLGGGSGGMTKLQDGMIQPFPDDTADTVYFGAAASIFVDLKAVVPIGMINTFSRHENGGEVGGGARAPQSYNLYGSTDGTNYTLITSVSNTIGGGAWGNSITAWNGGDISFGSYRYLRFDTLQTQAVTAQSWTFYGEIDVFTASANPAVDSVTYVNPTTVNVGFFGSTTSSTMDPSSATATANYTLDNGAVVQGAALLADGVTVQLTTSPLALGATYHLTVAGVRDAAANVISPNPTAVPFVVPTALTIASAAAPNLTHVTIVYSKNVSGTSAGVAANYQIAGLTVTGVAVNNATTVTLTVSTMLLNMPYTVTINNVQDVSVPPVTIAANSTKSFTTPSAPTLVSAVTASQTSITVAFSKAMSSATLTNPANYTINGLSVLAATASASGVTLTVSPMTYGRSYTVSVSNVQDTAAITIIPNPSATTFTFQPRNQLLVYSFTSTTASNADGTGYDPTPVATGVDQTAAGTVLTHFTWGAGMVAGGTQLIDTTDAGGLHYPTAPVVMVHPSSGTGSSSVASTILSVTSSSYMQFAVQPVAGQRMMLSTLDFDIARGNSTTPRGVGIETSIDGFGTATNQIIYSFDAPTIRPTWTHVTVDLSAAKFQNIVSGTPIVFRLYFYTPAAGQSVEFDNVVLYGAVVSAVTLPTVAITSPTSTYAANLGSTINLVATASTTAAGGSIAAVKFYDGATLLGSGTLNTGNGTWTYAWNTTGAAGGLHSVTAVATDNIGTPATSAPATAIQFQIVARPTVAITAPASALVAGKGWHIAMSASCTNGSPGTVTGVEIFDGATDLGPGVYTAGVWTYSWDTTAARFGLHSIRARVSDNAGATGTSSVVIIQVRLAADGNGDNIVDGLDYGVWQNGYMQPWCNFLGGDYNGDGVVDGLDYGTWQNNYMQTSGSGDTVVYAATGRDAAADSAPMAQAAPAAPAASVGSAPRLIAVTPASGDLATGVTRLTLVFDCDVQVAARAVEVSGLQTGPRQYTAAYDSATKTLAIVFPSALAPDRYTVRVVGSFVVGADGGIALDGDVGNPAAATLPSGSGAPGSDALIEFTAE